jgi:hypothetical protein
MPNPDGNPKGGVILVGTMATAQECEQQATKIDNATSWTYNHCDFPPAGSGNYSCHCYIRTDGKWALLKQNLVDSGYIKPGLPTPATPSPPTPSPPTPFVCTTNFDCQLNGACKAGVCECDAAWIGEQCERLNLLPTRVDNGLQDAELSSWGGSVLYNATDGVYHMYAAVFENGCGLGAWLPNSAIGHAISDSVTGPYTLEKPMIKARFAHEPKAVVAPDGNILIFHIGAGISSGTGYTNCSGGRTVGCQHGVGGKTW